MLEGLLRNASPGEAVEIREGVTLEVLVDEPNHLRHAEVDMEIIQRALLLEQITGAGVRLLTGDLNMKLRARSLGAQIFELDPRFKSQQQKRLLAEVEAEERAASEG